MLSYVGLVFFSYMDHCSFFSPMCSPRGRLWKTVLRGETGTTQFPFSDVTDHKLSSNLFYDRLLPHVGGPVSKGKGSASVRKHINRRRYRGKRPPSDQTLLTQIPPTSYISPKKQMEPFFPLFCLKKCEETCFLFFTLCRPFLPAD